MLTHCSPSNQIFDPVEFELERETVFSQTEKIVPSTKYSCYSASFSDGEWDAKIGCEPNQEQWISSADYRKGYLSGTEEKYNDQFSQLV